MGTTIDDSRTIDDRTGDQDHATVASVRAMIPEEFRTEAVTMAEVRAFQMDIDKDQDRQEAKRDGQTVSNYYFNRLQMKELEDHLRIEFPQTWESKFRVTENFTRSTSRQLSTIYKKAPTREPISMDGTEIGETELEEQKKIINNIYKRGQIDKSFQEIERFAKWAKSVLCRVIWQPNTNKPVLKPYPPQFYDVMISDSGILQAVIISDYQPGQQNAAAKKGRNFWVWTATEIAHFKGVEMVQKKIMTNELGMIPFVFFNDELPVENEKPYLHADTLLSNANLAINRMLTDGMSLIKNKTYGQPYIAGGDVDSLPKTTGHEEVWHVPRGQDDTQNPEIGMLEPSGDIDSILKLIERVANGYGTSRGLAPDSFSAQRSSQAQSGLALKIKNHNLIDMRDSEELKYFFLENEIFPILRAFHNLFKGAENGHNLNEIREDFALNVHFQKNDMAFESPVEVQRQNQSEVSSKLLKPTDFVRQRFPHMDEDEAMTYLKQVEEQLKELGFMTSLSAIDEALGIEPEGGQDDDDDDLGDE